MSKISQLPIPIGPTTELQEAMRLLNEGLLAAVDIEAELAAASVSAAARRSILKAAFMRARTSVAFGPGGRLRLDGFIRLGKRAFDQVHRVAIAQLIRQCQSAQQVFDQRGSLLRKIRHWLAPMADGRQGLTVSVHAFTFAIAAPQAASDWQRASTPHTSAKLA